ncbi:MAG: hypothetical protein QOF21_1018 [Actinomycetota bacterium]|jgi:peptidoglycan/LPS O-acetylase OafA/YrhL
MNATTAVRPRLDALTSLRFVAAFVVFMHHAGPFLPDDPLHRVTAQGATGVSFFFVLSGFVLTWSRRSTDTPVAFFRRRFARIWPAHVVALAVLILLPYGPMYNEFRGGAAGTIACVLLVQAWSPSETIYFAGNAPTWSLSCEVFFYALFPAMVHRIAALSHRRQTQLAVGLFAVPLVIATVSASSKEPFWAWLRYISPPVRLTEFGLGILVALAVQDGRWRKVPVWVATVLTCGAYLLAGYVPAGFLPVAVTLAPICLLIGTVAAHELAGTVPRILRAKWAVRLGVWSFCFYLVHQFTLGTIVTYFVRHHGTGFRVYLAADIVAFFAALAGAALLHQYVEKPFERRLRGTAQLPQSSRA